MKLFDRLKKAFGAEPTPIDGGSALPVEATVTDGKVTSVGPKPGKIDIRHLLQFLRGGFRKPPHTRVYRKRGPKKVLIGHDVVLMGHRAARLHFIYTGMREANEVRRSFRERQLEARAERRALFDDRIDRAIAAGVW